MSMLSEEARQEMYGDMTAEEIELCYHHNGLYKGWRCYFTGCGKLVFLKAGQAPVEAYRSLQTKNWIPECWKECKSKIDALEHTNI